MGAYDRVKFVGYCPKCGARITDYQTKDKFASLSERHVEEANDWYGECPDCNLYIKYTRFERPQKDVKENIIETAEIHVNYVNSWDTVKGQIK